MDSFEADDLAKPLLFDFDELHLDFDELHLDHVRLDERDEEEYPLFCAASVTGSSNAMGMNAIPIRLRIIKSFLLETDATGLSPFLKGDARELEQDDHPHPAPERAPTYAGESGDRGAGPRYRSAHLVLPALGRVRRNGLQSPRDREPGCRDRRARPRPRCGRAAR